MRSKKWYAELTEELRQTTLELPLEVLCPVELGLTLLSRLDKAQPPTSVWPLLGGYPFAKESGLADDPAQAWMITCVRHRLWPLRRPESWLEALRDYQGVDSDLRAFRIAEDFSFFEWTGTTTLTTRFPVYEQALSTLPDYVDSRPAPAKAGRYFYYDRDERVEVEIPADVADRARDVPGHDLMSHTVTNGEPLDITWAALGETARWMDTRAHEDERANWQASIESTRLLVRDIHGHDFVEGDRLRFDGLLHAVGVVGVGKSTLMKVLAVWAVRQDKPLRITLVVGDVAEQLATTRELRSFLDVGKVVPIIGSSNREQHVEGLHRRLASNGHVRFAGHHEDEGFADLGTACPLDALRAAETPVRSVDAPCTRLYAVDSQVTDRKRPSPSSCPLWHECPRHVNARDQVGARVWVANMASLVASPLQTHVGGVRLRQLELACLRSDLVVIDEADRVMMNLDMVFAPTATLVSREPHSWLDTLYRHNILELSRAGRLQLSDRYVRNWEVALSVVSGATNQLYSMLIADQSLRDWVGIEYFNSWTLQGKLLKELYRPGTAGTDDEEDEEIPAAEPGVSRAEAAKVFDQFRDDPLGDNGPYETLADRLAATTQDLLHTLNRKAVAHRLAAVIGELLVLGTPEKPGHVAETDPQVRKLEFVLLLSALHHRLDRLTHLWPLVEDAMRLDAKDNELIRRPPMDYLPLVPESPMGNVLGFQYVVDDGDGHRDGVTGTLRFFRCTGVGRELLLSLPSLGVDTTTGRGGPHVLLLSGTSWAGTSTRAHVVAPVSAVLRPSHEAEERVKETVFKMRFFHDADGNPISLSGRPPRIRSSLLRSLVDKLGKPGPSGISPLEEEIRAVGNPNRQRALLLVGNYQEARDVADQLDAMPGWHGHVKALVRDNADLDDAVADGTDDLDRAGVIRRGNAGLFATDAMARVLVAPMLAIERGYNILNRDNDAALGVALLLTRPHPVPTDIGLSVLAINDWESRYTRGLPTAEDTDPASFAALVASHDTLDSAGRAFRALARSKWGRLLIRKYAYSVLSKDEQRSFAWDQLVVLWQVIGRLVRGGVAARVVFVDAKFELAIAEARSPNAQKHARRRRRDHSRSSLLHGIRDALRPYFEPRPDDDPVAPADMRLAELLYKPVYLALCRMLDEVEPVDLDGPDLLSRRT
ncbi:hypothetical protein ACFQ05_03375 [Amycolatopsis umgeniensis]|uniref:pPIWI-RE three-gene island domain-containing protein n=1 Tax=Amycolatopsis umgeniensis TaxID=336628 RepID=A0A841B112_9PSEU|nr:hypothetical protein [Amycolatopsis umgeniensis]MBB5852302.1 hypothetical protein [Amycolatopsis umgeniensis]